MPLSEMRPPRATRSRSSYPNTCCPQDMRKPERLASISKLNRELGSFNAPPQRQSIDRQDALEDRSGRKDASEKTPHLLARTHDFARVQSKSLSKLGHAFVWHKFGNLKCLVVSFGDSVSRECHTSCEDYCEPEARITVLREFGILAGAVEGHLFLAAGD